MSASTRQAAGREWAYQLRQISADLEAQGQSGRARELARLADATERQIAGREVAATADAACAAGQDGDCAGHPSMAEAFVCALNRMGEGDTETDRLRRIVGRAARHVRHAMREVAWVPWEGDDEAPADLPVLSEAGYEHLGLALDALANRLPAPSAAHGRQEVAS